MAIRKLSPSLFYAKAGIAQTDALRRNTSISLRASGRTEISTPSSANLSRS